MLPTCLASLPVSPHILLSLLGPPGLPSSRPPLKSSSPLNFSNTQVGMGIAQMGKLRLREVLSCPSSRNWKQLILASMPLSHPLSFHYWLLLFGRLSVGCGWSFLRSESPSFWCVSSPQLQLGAGRRRSVHMSQRQEGCFPLKRKKSAVQSTRGLPW